MKKYLLVCCLFIIGIQNSYAMAHPKYLCVSKDNDVHLEIGPNDDVWFTRKLEVDGHQSFGGKLLHSAKQFVFENYNTKIILYGKYIERHMNANWYIDNKLYRSLNMYCEKYQLSNIQVKKTSFPMTLKNMAMRSDDPDYNPYTKMKLAKRIKNEQRFHFSYYQRDLAFELADIGDWYTVDLNELQVRLIKRYLEKNRKGLLELIKENHSLHVAGYLFARDWYYGDGYIGVVVVNKNELLIVPVSFESTTFGDTQLDYIY